ncbi:hypothetical protein DA103_06785 [Enterobacter cloacae]|jgi:hypothetical protein|uniref:Lipoprotein n=1 Tax=Enterobacter cloacae TaxID=550 RepID=A0A2T4Y3W5_ENTCL|nr:MULTISPECIES: hypothetical protein [Enterobacter]HDT2074339.1 hypothetical protein [Enterobacter roggenkampii]HEG2001891.1 hypothetical protein [Enterobacter asburiae]MCD2459277.1 hypothetical protein [Enterobacter cloacae complex sp. 2021EL-01261]MCR1305222.1 hypothetical protein [Enterobacter sp. FL1277]MCR1310252.1 hypothetical protein [Enterobacter sp. BT1271]
MKIQSITLAMLAFIAAPAWSAFQEREYNTWYIKNAVLYDMTQTSEGFPVMVSISQPERRSANLLVSYISEGQCGGDRKELNVNGKALPAQYHCVQVGLSKIEHFSVIDADSVNGMVTHLKSDFTVLLQNDIKVWAANIKTPKYGLTPRF